jgi:TRAP-type C4-dicarboxylate transport system permease small subunit
MEKFTKIYKKICVALAWISALGIALMILSTSLDTSMRFLFNSPLPGVFELNEVLLVVVVFLGIAWTQGERGHTRVVVVMRRLDTRLALKIDIICWILCILFLAALGVQTAKEALRSFSINEFRWGSVQMPIWWAKGLVPLGCWLTCVQLLVDVWRDLQMLRGRLPVNIPDFALPGD